MKLEEYLKENDLLHKLHKIKDRKLYYNGDLLLEGINITSLPNNLIVEGCLDLLDTGITKLPDNLVVKGFLDIRDTAITTLPDNLYVYGRVYVEDTVTISFVNSVRNGKIVKN